MIINLFYLIMLGVVGSVELLLSGISALVPNSVESSINDAVSTIGTKINAVYHMIPAANHLLIILTTILTISAVLLSIRIFIFFYNKIRGSGGNI